MRGIILIDAFFCNSLKYSHRRRLDWSFSFISNINGVRFCICWGYQTLFYMDYQAFLGLRMQFYWFRITHLFIFEIIWGTRSWLKKNHICLWICRWSEGLGIQLKSLNLGHCGNLSAPTLKPCHLRRGRLHCEAGQWNQCAHSEHVFCWTRFRTFNANISMPNWKFIIFAKWTMFVTDVLPPHRLLLLLMAKVRKYPDRRGRNCLRKLNSISAKPANLGWKIWAPW